MTGDLILRIVAKLLMPFMLLFALYVQFHGDYGPGGGFQAGVIAAAAIVFYAITFGLAAAQRLVPERLVERLLALGVLLYAGVGLAGLALGLAIVVRIREAYGTIEEDEILAQDRAEEVR